VKLKFLFSWILIFASCVPAKKTSVSDIQGSIPVSSIKFLDEYVLPNNLIFQNTWVGGLSGIDYNKQEKCFYFICDERSATSAARFYKAAIDLDNFKIDSIRFLSVHDLRNAKSDTFPSEKIDPPHATDPESIRYNSATQSLVWCSEGDKAMRLGRMIYQNPCIYEMRLNGNFLDSFYLPQNVQVYKENIGVRNNSVLEGLSFTNDHKFLWTSMEGPIHEDGPLASPVYANAPVRFIKFDATTRKPVAQYGYLLDAVAHPPAKENDFFVNGVSEILGLGGERFLVLERSFTKGIAGCVIKIFLADFSKATNVMEVKSLYENSNYSPSSKKLILKLNDTNRYIDNVEGVSFGPVLPNGHQSLILISDNNFNFSQKSQIFLFEIIP